MRKVWCESQGQATVRQAHRVRGDGDGDGPMVMARYGDDDGHGLMVWWFGGLVV